jgi:hypothetical protein
VLLEKGYREFVPFLGKPSYGQLLDLETTSDSAQALIDHCTHEITDGPYIQRASEMMKDEADFLRINQLMNRYLDAFASQ